MEFNGTFLASIITFIVFVFVMNKVLYAPILGIMRERECVIKENYESAEENNLRADALEEEKDAKLNNAKDEARGKYIDALDEYKAQKSEVISDAQNSAREDAEKANAELNEVSNQVKEGLKSSMNDLANDIVEKVIGYRTDSNGFDDGKISEILYH